MKRPPLQEKAEKVRLNALKRQFKSLRHQTGSLNEVERYNIVRKSIGLKEVK